MTTYITEIIPAKNSKLKPLEDRDEYMFTNQEAEKEFKKKERRLVKERRDKYANKVKLFLFSPYYKNKDKAKVREIVETDVQERKLRATIVIQKFFKNRQSVVESRKATIHQNKQVTNDSLETDKTYQKQKNIDNEINKNEKMNPSLNSKEGLNDEMEQSTGDKKKKERRKRGL